QVQAIDDCGIGHGGDINHDLIPSFKCVDMMKGKKCLAPIALDHFSIFFPHYKEACPLLRLPLEILDEWLPAYQHIQWIHYKREFDQYHVVLCNTEAVYITWLLDGDRADQCALSAAICDSID